MIRPVSNPAFAPTLLALALLAAFGSARAEDEPPPPPESSVTVGAGLLSGSDADRALFGQYNGLRTHGASALLGFQYRRRDDETGTSLRLEGSELLGSLRELELAWKKPGDWKFSISYGETLREEPNRASTGADLQLKRSKVGVALLKTLGPQLQLDVSLSSENKDGLRLFGIGMNCPSAVAPGCGGTTGAQVGWAVLMLPEPVNANHSQIEARLSYTGDKLYVSAGYYGSFYQNQFGSLSPNVPGALNNAVGTPLPLAPGLQAILNQPVALPPDNQAHQIDLSGRYSFTPTTHLNFKLSHAQALQHDDFAAAGFTGAPAGVSNLGGRVDTTLAQLGLSARPWAKLTLQAKLRYEDTDDSTPIALYNVEDTATYTNRRLPGTKLRGQLQAHYQFSSDYRGTLGAEAESIDRGVFTATSAAAGITALRQKTDETTVRAELRRRMNEQLSGAISVSRSRRDGSNWLRDNSGTGVTEVPDASDPSTGFARGIFMPTLADRQRDKLRLQADWQPSDELSLQLSAQHGIDRFSTPSVYGVQTSGMDQFEFDASYALTERWSLNGNLSYGTETLRQARPDAAALAYDNTSSGFGVGISGKATSTIQVGANLSHLDDRSSYAQALDSTADGASAALLAATGGLPDIIFRQTTLKLFGIYTLDKQSDLRLDLGYQRSTWSDWSWSYNGVPFTYSDGTVVGQPVRQRVGFVGLRYTYRWQ
ncbi:MAG TPA: MtrB/PioB family decaheme-associated outer membrane protein [Piscinibacter sp.]|mgnify:FL=1|nr:MtrB/PioB family decaheme-associated outer membrane protein [Piscinibacter sp.]